MRVPALSDIDGHLSSLEAAVTDIDREDVDAIVVGGDSIFGPWPVEVLRGA
jgi:predicted phosphodiesterase